MTNDPKLSTLNYDIVLKTKPEERLSVLKSIGEDGFNMIDVAELTRRLLGKRIYGK